MPSAPRGQHPATFQNRIDGGLDELLIDGDLKLDLAQQVEAKLVSAIDTRVTLLPSESLAVHDGQTKDVDFGQCLFYSF